VLRLAELRGLGVQPPAGAVPAGDWVLHAGHAAALRARLRTLLTEHGRGGELTPGPTLEEARLALGLPGTAVVRALVTPPLTVRDGRIQDPAARPVLPPPLTEAIGRLRRELEQEPFQAPEADRLRALRLGARELAAAERAGALLRVSDAIVLLPGADQRAADVLKRLPQPFTTSQARQALNTTRRVALPLLDLLDRRGLTRRLPDDRREVR
jgi:selenocysteine-specific elongation factor